MVINLKVSKFNFHYIFFQKVQEPYTGIENSLLTQHSTHSLCGTVV